MFRRLWFFITRWQRMQDLDEEMRMHVELRAAANRCEGMSPEEAARQAHRHFGNLLKLREEARDVWGFAELERIGGDLRHAVRRLVQHPAGTLVVVATLALGIGATTAMFTLLDAMLLRPAHWNRNGRAVWVVGLEGRSSSPRNVSYPEYLTYRSRMTTLSGLAAESGTAMTIGSRQPQRVLGGLVSGNYFDVLGLRAQIGRTFAPDEDDPRGAHAVVVLGDALWTGQFGRDPGVIGTDVSINGRPFTVIGVAPRGFTGAAFATNPYQLWLPMAMLGAVMPGDGGRLTDATQRWLHVVGRLRDGVTAGEADAEARVIARQMNSQTPAMDGRHAGVLAIRGGLMPWEQESLAPIFGLVSIVPALVLLVACANAANVLIAHHTGRRREFAMRRAIGASRGRLVRQLVAESLVAALLAGLAGFGTAFVLSATIVHFGEVPSEVSALLALDGRALVAAITVALAAIVLFGVAPALTTTRFDVLPVLKDEGGANSTTSLGPRRLRRALVVAQVALSLTLLVITGLFFQSLSRAMRVDPGFDAQRLATVSFDLDLQGYPPDRRAAFAAHFVERVSDLADVSSVAAADVLPLGNETYAANIISEKSSSGASVARVSPKYFDTIGVPILRGRAFTHGELAANAPVAIVNETLARNLWHDVDPLGRKVRLEGSDEPWREVVGIARDSKYRFLTESPQNAYYVPLAAQSSGTFVIRTAGSPRAVLAALKDVARDLDPDLPIASAQTMEERVRSSVRLRRAVVSLLGVLGALTLILASVGIYGVAAHGVSMRTREVGIRISFGARASDVMRMILRESLFLSLLGAAIGCGISAAGATMLASYLFGVTAADSATFAGGAVVLCLISLVASYVPARRAARVDPSAALRMNV